jgi:hypothetical protein
VVDGGIASFFAPCPPRWRFPIVLHPSRDRGHRRRNLHSTQPINRRDLRLDCPGRPSTSRFPSRCRWILRW